MHGPVMGQEHTIFQSFSSSEDSSNTHSRIHWLLGHRHDHRRWVPCQEVGIPNSPTPRRVLANWGGDGEAEEGAEIEHDCDGYVD